MTPTIQKEKKLRPYLGLRISTLVFGILTFISLLGIFISLISFAMDPNVNLEEFKNKHIPWWINKDYLFRDLYKNGSFRSSRGFHNVESLIIPFIPTIILSVVFFSLSIACVVKMRSKYIIFNLIISIFTLFALISFFTIVMINFVTYDVVFYKGNMDFHGWDPDVKSFDNLSWDDPSWANEIKQSFIEKGTSEVTNTIPSLISMSSLMGISAVMTISSSILAMVKPVATRRNINSKELSKKETTKIIIKNKKTIFILSSIMTLFTIMAVGLFASSNWIDYNNPIIYEHELIKSNGYWNLIISATAMFTLALIIAFTTWIISLKTFFKYSRTKLSIFGISMLTIGIFAILLPMVVISVLFALGEDAYWLNYGMNNLRNWGTQGVNMTPAFSIINTIYTYGTVVVSLLLICQIIFVVLMGIDTFANTKISNEIKSGGILNSETSEYRRGLHKIFRLLISNLFAGLTIIFMCIFMPPWMIIFSYSFKGASNHPMIALIAMIILFIILILIVLITCVVIMIKIVIEAMRLDSKDGYIQSIHGPEISTIKLVACIGLFINVANIFLLVLVHRAIADDKWKKVVSKTKKTEKVESSEIDIKAKLKKVETLLNEKLISEAEYNKMRKKILEDLL